MKVCLGYIMGISRMEPFEEKLFEKTSVSQIKFREKLPKELGDLDQCFCFCVGWIIYNSGYCRWCCCISILKNDVFCC